jgi:hypothetical protein
MLAAHPFLLPLVPKTEKSRSVLNLAIASPVQGATYIDPTIHFGDVSERTAYTFTAGVQTPVSVRILNDGLTPFRGSIVARLYEGARSPLSKAIHEVTHEALVHPHASSTIVYSLPPLQGTSYYLEMYLVSGSVTQSVVGIQLTKDGVCARPFFESDAWHLGIILIGIVLVLVAGGIGGYYFFLFAKKNKLFKRRHS